MHTVADAAVLGKPAAPTRPDTQRGTEPAVVRSQQADLAQGVDRSVCSRTDYQLLCLQQPARQLGRRPVHRLARQSPHTQELLHFHHRWRRPEDDHRTGAAVAGQGVVADAAHRWHIDRLRGCGRISHHHRRHSGHLREQGRCHRRRHHGHHHLRPRGQRAYPDQRHHHLRQHTYQGGPDFAGHQDCAARRQHHQLYAQHRHDCRVGRELRRCRNRRSRQTHRQQFRCSPLDRQRFGQWRPPHDHPQLHDCRYRSQRGR